jgi:hypothetical protein
MAGLLDLRRRAEDACETRGHRLGKWVTIHGESQSLANNECTDCGAGVQCNTRPQPNGIDIGGEALALNCTR